MEDILEGEPINPGLEDLPTLMGLIDVREPMPAEAGSAYGLERYWSRNWAGNVEWSHGGNYHEPETLEELQAIVADADKLRCLGLSANGISEYRNALPQPV